MHSAIKKNSIFEKNEKIMYNQNRALYSIEMFLTTKPSGTEMNSNFEGEKKSCTLTWHEDSSYISSLIKADFVIPHGAGLLMEVAMLTSWLLLALSW